MPISVSCQCGRNYNLKDEYAATDVQCPDCGGTIAVRRAPDAVAPDPVFSRDKFLLRQKHLSISEKYYVWDEQGNVILFVERPAHLLRGLLALLAGVLAGAVVAILLGAIAAASNNDFISTIFGGLGLFGFILTTLIVTVALSQKRHILFYRDDTRNEKLLEIKQDQKLHILTATYTLNDAAERVIARFHKNYLYNIFRKRWNCYRPDGTMICVAKEDSLILSLLRRVLGPLFGILRTNFIILEGQTENVAGEFNRNMTLLDRYALDMTADRQRRIDRRVAMALGVLLDTGERR